MATEERSTTVLIIGSGPAGLINARTLLQDGFRVTMVSKKPQVGGLWSSTYPDLQTNHAWGAFTFSGLDMLKPNDRDGKTVPAETYRRYLQDFHRYFVQGKANMRYNTEVSKLEPQAGGGWTATFVVDGRNHVEDFDRVVLATGYLGKPRIPGILQNSPIPVYHSSSLAQPSVFNSLLSKIPSSPEPPTIAGDRETILVVGGGKSGMDMATLLTNHGRKVVWTHRSPLKWFSPATPPGLLGAGRMDIIMGPKRYPDSWAMWFYHHTSLGARWINNFWTMMRGAWSSLYSDKLPSPPTNPFLTLAHFAGAIPTDPGNFKPLLEEGKIASTGQAEIKAVSEKGITLLTKEGDIMVECGAIVAATGFEGGVYDYIDAKTRVQLGLEKVEPREGWRDRVLTLRRSWKTVKGDEMAMVFQPLVYRGMLPAGRLAERDLAISGGTRPFAMPGTAYEVESHWISSLFKNDPFLRLPRNEQQILDECHADNEYNLARYPGIDPYASIPSGTYFVGFNDLYHNRVLLRDMQLDPWRQKSRLGWWNPKRWLGGWLDVTLKADDYATLSEDRRVKRG